MGGAVAPNPTLPAGLSGGSLSGALGPLAGGNSAFSGMLGAAGGAGGTGFAGPAGTSLIPTTDQGQLATSLGGAQNSLASQQALLAALQSQNGLGAQNGALSQMQGLSNTLAAQSSPQEAQAATGAMANLANNLSGVNSVGVQNSALGQQQGLLNALQGANGVGNLSNSLAAQQNLAQQQQSLGQQYQNIASGQGPNPAQAALNQSTNQNVANQAALMAGQRGAGANVGLMARQIAQQGANTQQQAVGQAATMQAQQELNALSGLSAQQQAQGATQQSAANIAGQLVGAQQAGIGAQQQAASNITGQLQGQQQQLGNQALAQTNQGMQQQVNAANQANQIAGQQIAGTSGLSQAQQNEQQILQNAAGNLNQQNVGMQGNINQGNTSLATTREQQQGSALGGAASGAAKGIATAVGGMAKGGEVKMASGGAVSPPPVPMQTTGIQLSPISQMIMGYTAQPQNQPSLLPNGSASVSAPPSSSDDDLRKGSSQLGKAGTQKLLKALSPSGASAGTGDAMAGGADASELGAGAMIGGADAGAAGASAAELAPLLLAYKGGDTKDLRAGGAVKASSSSQKAVKKGDDYDNDKIDAKLSEHEIVLPRSVTMSKDPVKASADFVAAVLAKRGRHAYS